ncbi:MmcQ/YjbR family DNA-binding protein [Mumia sp. Pv 4-285]|uniref:MmcQ/YjbR family DNA-binding protein n=1 Tax=Mumia qirimensis TaxID=3234852 RepID=UPI00351D8CA5
MAERPEVPVEILDRLRATFSGLPSCDEEDAWVGVRWRVGTTTVAHVFGGEDGLFRITFRAEPGELMAFEQLGPPYFRAEWGDNVVGMLLDDATDWDELAELLVDAYCLQAPARLVEQVERPSDSSTPPR